MEMTEQDKQDLRFLKFEDVAPHHIAAYADWKVELKFMRMLAEVPAHKYERRRRNMGLA
jgi:hypothetical protein